MKQIITLLLIILVSIPVNAQSIEQEKQEFENEKTARFSRPIQIQNDRSRNNQTRDFILKRKTEFLKTMETKYLDSLIYKERDEGSNIWRYTRKKVFTYENDKIATTILFNWDNNTSCWLPYQKDEFTFDTNGNLVTEIRYLQFTPNVWVLDKKSEYSYIIDGYGPYQLALEENYTWNSMSSQWNNTYKYELTYNSYSSLILELGFEWNKGTNQWINLSKHEYFRDDILLDYEIISNWNNVTNQWDFNSKLEYSRGNFHAWVPDVKIILSRDLNNTEWVNEFKYEYEYDSGAPDGFPRQICETGYSWNTEMNQWETNYKDEYEYPNNHLSISTYFEWNESTSDWEPHYKDEFIFDTAFTQNDFINPFNYNYSQEFEDTPWVAYYYMMIGYRSYEYVYAGWEDRTRMLFYYSNYANPLQVEKQELAKSIKVYPNPVSNILFFDSEFPIEKVEIYSIHGKKVKEIRDNLEAISLNDIANGIYLVKIQSDNMFTVRKIIKRF